MALHATESKYNDYDTVLGRSQSKPGDDFVLSGSISIEGPVPGTRNCLPVDIS